MKDGFVKVAAATPHIKVADPVHNATQVIALIRQAVAKQVKVLVLPELCMTGYTCGDLFLQQLLLKEAEEQMKRIAIATQKQAMLVVVGTPIVQQNKLYNCAAVLYEGNILGLVPKTWLPSYTEYYEGRHFSKGSADMGVVQFAGQQVPMGTNLLFANSCFKEMVLACEICEDLWVPSPPGEQHALAGATILCNPSASVETTTKEAYRRNLVSIQSAKLLCGYIYADAGEGESTTDVIYSAHNMICENGTVLKEAKRFENEMICTEIDVYKLDAERRRMTTFGESAQTLEKQYRTIYFSMAAQETVLTRYFSQTPFIPSNEQEKILRCDEILKLQSMGLKKRLEHTHAQTAVIGISGGLDSTLAMLVTVRAFDMAGLDRQKITCITMPCYGTTDRTYHNACALVKSLGAKLLEIPIRDAVEQHFKDIHHDPCEHDVTYENCQARERTQVLMDVANQSNGMVIGTGDLSELALGWATYNGDHMSMYAVNASVPKTLVRHLVRYYADTCENAALKQVLLDVLDTPVSPELLPPEEGKIAQKTEDIVGPYELHDFYLYYMLRFGYPPKKLYRIACYVFAGKYETEVIYHWMRIFYWRFFAQQFKRSCIPDGPKVGSVSLSPRGDFRMPSDASAALWMREMDALSKDR